MSTARRYVIPVSDLSLSHDVGEKAKVLHTLQQNEINIPETLVILEDAYHNFVKHNNLDKKIKHLLGALDLQNIGHVNRAYDFINKYLTESEIPNDLLKEIIKEYKKLGVTLEDAKIKIYFSNYNHPSQIVSGDSSLLHEIRNKWRSIYSLFSPKGNPTIIIQRQTIGKHGQIRTSTKQIKTDTILTKEENQRLEELITKLRKIFYFPQEIEWSFEKGKLYVHSVRPETQKQEHGDNLAKGAFEIIKNSHLFN